MGEASKLRDRRALFAIVTPIVAALLVVAIVRPVASAGFTRGNGYWLASAAGSVYAFGDGSTYGSADGRSASGIVGMAARPTGKGYWLAAGDGSVLAFGDAPGLGEADKKTFKGKISAIAATPSGNGYWLAGEKGEVMAFGDAPALGTAEKRSFAGKIVDIAATPSGRGFALLSSSGEILTFGDAVSFGSADGKGSVALAMMPKGDGYWILGDKGDVLAFGAARLYGSGQKINGPIVDIAATISGKGYWLTGSDGTVIAFGDAVFYGGLGRPALRGAPIVAIVTTPFVNHPPIAVADAATLDEDTSIDINVLANDVDIDGDPIAATLVAGAAHGLVTQNADGSFHYQPAPDYNGTDAFTYRATDPFGLFSGGTVSLTIRPVNDPPVARDDAYITDEDIALHVAAPGVLANDSDVDHDTLHVTVTTPPQHGTLTLGADGSIDYLSALDYNGSDSFAYQAADGNGGFASATVRITIVPVPDPPAGVPEAYTTDEDVALTVPAATGILANDSDPDGDAFTAVLLQGASHGTLTLHADGSFSYLGSRDFNGVDAFTYRAFDGALYSQPTLVTLNVTPVNDAPVALGDRFETNEDTLLNGAVLTNDSDVDGDRLTVEILSGPTNGALAMQADGTFTYLPGPDYNGADAFTYRAFDGSLYSDPARVALTVIPVNDPPVARDDSYTTDEDTALRVAVPGVLANDSDVDHDTLHVTVTTPPQHGALTLGADGAIEYLSEANYNGSDSFGYQVSDGNGGLASATVRVTIVPVPDPPAAMPDSYKSNEDTALAVTAGAGVLPNDSDADGDAFTAVLLADVSHGTLTLQADGSFSYLPAPDFNGVDTFTYRAFDGALYSDPTVVTLNIAPVADAPRPIADEYATDEDTQLDVAAPGVLGNDTDPDSPTIAPVLGTAPSHGRLELGDDGAFAYRPNADFNGTDSFTYTATDGVLTSGPVTVTITVNPVNDPPAGVEQSYTTDEDTMLTVAAPGLLQGASDVDGDPLTVVLFSSPDRGTLELASDGSFTYLPDPNYNGTDTFSYRVSDGEALTDPITVTITINPVSDPPTAVDDRYSTTVGATLTVPAPGVLANDVDDSGVGLTAALVTSPAHGTLTLNADGSFTYQTNLTAAGEDSFDYTASDGTTVSDPATVTITVTGGSTGGGGGSSNGFNGFITPTETVFDFDSLLVGGGSVTEQPKHGTIVTRAGGQYYVPDAGYRGTDTFVVGGRRHTVDVLSAMQGDY